MMLRTTGAKIALSRRNVPTQDTGSWRIEFFTVTQDLIDAGKLVLADIPITNTEMIKLNGLEMTSKSGWDYTMNGNEIIFADDILLVVGDTIRIRYKI